MPMALNIVRFRQVKDLPSQPTPRMRIFSPFLSHFWVSNASMSNCENTMETYEYICW